MQLRKIKLLIIAILLCSITCAQKDSIKSLKKNALFAEVGGNGLLYSLNYERLVYQKNKIHFCVRVGIMAIPDIFSNQLYSMYPVEINFLLGKRHDFFEAGIGNTYNSTKHSQHISPTSTNPYKLVEYYSHYAFLRIGYRLQIPRRGGFVLRVAALPYMNYKQGYEKTSNKPEFGFDELSFDSISEDRSSYKYEFGIWGGLSFGFSF